METGIAGEAAIRFTPFTIKPSTSGSSGATALFAGTSASDNGTDYCGIWVDQTNLNSTRFGIGIGCVQRYTPLSQPAANQAITSGLDMWNIAGANLLGPAAITIDEHNGATIQSSFFADTGKTATFTLSRTLKITAATKLGAGAFVLPAHYGIDIESQLAVAATNSAAIRLRAQNFIKSLNNAANADRALVGLDSSDNAVVGDVNIATLLSGSVIVNGAAQASQRSTITYSASMTPNALAGNQFTVTVTNATAMAINAPTNPITGTISFYTIRNTSGGAMGVITWNAVFKLNGGATGFTNPATANSRTIAFIYDGAAHIELFRSAADVPN